MKRVCVNCYPKQKITTSFYDRINHQDAKRCHNPSIGQILALCAWIGRRSSLIYSLIQDKGSKKPSKTNLKQRWVSGPKQVWTLTQYNLFAFCKKKPHRGIYYLFILFRPSHQLPRTLKGFFKIQTNTAPFRGLQPHLVYCFR